MQIIIMSSSDDDDGGNYEKRVAFYNLHVAVML